MGVDRILSTAGIGPVDATKLRSYCNLMQSSLKDNWLFADEFIDCHVCFVADDYIQSMPENSRKKAQVLVVVANSIYSQIDEDKYPYQLQLPLNASKVRGVLNIISREFGFSPLRSEMSQTQVSDETGTVVNRFKNAFNNIRKTFLGKRDLNQPLQSTKKNFVSRITQELSLSKDVKRKVVFMGSPGSGKTTALSSCSHGNSLSSEVSATDSVAANKNKTTVGIDFANITLNNGTSIHLYGTPGQVKFNFIWDVVGHTADAFVILLDLSRPDPIQYLKFYKRFLLSEIGHSERIYCALTHCDKYDGDIFAIRNTIETQFPKIRDTYNIDCRERDDLMILLEDISDSFKPRNDEQMSEKLQESVY